MKRNIGLKILEENRGEIEALCRIYGVERMRIFGSIVRDDWNPETSDFDFLVEFGPPPEGINLFKQQFGLAVKLERLLGRKVELVEWKVAEKPYFRAQAEAEAEDWYAA